MQLEDCFDFLDELDIRVRGTRVGIETILTDYLELGLSAEEIASRYSSLTLAQVYATLTYYCYNREKIDAYLKAFDEEMARQRQEQNANPPAFLLRLRALARRPNIA